MLVTVLEILTKHILHGVPDHGIPDYGLPDYAFTKALRTPHVQYKPVIIILLVME